MTSPPRSEVDAAPDVDARARGDAAPDIDARARGDAAPDVDGPAEVDDVDADALATLATTLDYARRRDYVGWDLYDGESSRLLRALPVDSKWLNLAFQQAPRRAPVNVRPLLLVEQRRSFMGSALFAMACDRAASLTDDARYRRDARDLLDWLVANRSRGYRGFCGGHQHPFQGLSSRNEPGTPDVVSTSYAVRALLAVGDDDGAAGPTGDERARTADGAPPAIDDLTDGSGRPSRRAVARTAADFVLEDLSFRERDDVGAFVDYRPGDGDGPVTLNANALGARLLVDLYAAVGEERFRRRAEAILDYVASRQTERGGWTYCDPPSGSHLSMDNFHNGFVVESFARHADVCGSSRYDGTLDRARRFYRETLFDDDGAPNWDESSSYPRDVHASAQGIVTFSLLGDRAFARRILDWAVEHLSDGNGRFYFQRGRFHTKRITLMRWCQAWMAYAVATYLRPTVPVR